MKSILLLLAIVGCNANFYYNLDKLFNMNPEKPPQGATVIAGPNGKGQALVLGKDAPPSILDDNQEIAYLITAMTNSEDFTYSTWLRTPQEPLKKAEEWMFFTIQSKNLPNPVLFGVGLTYISKRSQGSEDEQVDGQYAQYLLMKQYKTLDLNTKSQVFAVKEDFKPNTWYQIQLRIKMPPKVGKRRRRRAAKDEGTVEVHVNCKSIGTFKLQDGPFDNYLPTGYATLGSSLDIKGSLKTPKNRFPGALLKSQLINGEAGYKLYSACDSNLQFKELPAEPLPSDYNDDVWNLYLKAAASVKIVSITCPGQTPTRYNGEKWIKGCYQYLCENGKVTRQYVCGEDTICTDPSSGKKYIKGESWIDPKDVCKNNTCVKEFDDITTKTIQCQQLTENDCNDGFAPIKLPNECCEKCPSDTCTGGRIYYAGCKKTCADGPSYICPTKEIKCWCPLGFAENDNGDCIPLNTCPCRSDTVIYQAGQTAVRSLCETCVCANGEMNCFKRC